MKFHLDFLLVACWDFSSDAGFYYRQFDPWRTSGVSSEFRPGGPLASTAQAPLQIIPGGFHCSDLILRNGAANAGVQNVINNEIAQIKTWVSEYYTSSFRRKRQGVSYGVPT